MKNFNEEDDALLDPQLRSLRNADPFRVPEGFFEHFPHQVQARAASRTKANVWSQPIAPWAWTIPALVIGVIALWWMLGRTNTMIVPQVAISLDDVSTDEALYFADADVILEISAYEAGDMYAPQDLELSSAEVLAFLDLDGTDLNELINDL